MVAERRLKMESERKVKKDRGVIKGMQRMRDSSFKELREIRRDLLYPSTRPLSDT